MTYIHLAIVDELFVHKDANNDAHSKNTNGMLIVTIQMVCP